MSPRPQIKKCDVCGKTCFEHAHDNQASCIKAAQFSDKPNDWKCLVTKSDISESEKSKKSVIRKIVPNILDALKPDITKVLNCVLIITPKACNLELHSELWNGDVEVVTIRMGDNLGYKTCIIARYVNGSLARSEILTPTFDASFFRQDVLDVVKDLRTQ